MSAVDISVPETPMVSTTSESQGPVEIIVGPAQTNLSSAPKGDVTDVAPKEAKTTTPVNTDDEISGDDDPADDDQPRDGKGRYRGVQARIDELTRSRREAEREAEYWKARVQGGTAQNPAPTPATTPPDPAKFKTQEDYIDAVTDFKVAQKLAEKDAEQSHVKQVNDRAQSWQEKLVVARAEAPDFDQVMNNADVPVSNHVADLLLESDAGAKIAYHLARNPDKLEAINGMTPAKVAIELGKLEASLTKSSIQATIPDVKTSKAPPPARTLGQGRSTTPQLADLSMEDYVRQRKSQGASWAR